MKALSLDVKDIITKLIDKLQEDNRKDIATTTAGLEEDNPSLRLKDSQMN